MQCNNQHLSVWLASLSPSLRTANAHAALIAVLVFLVVALVAFAAFSLLDQRNARARLIKDRLATVQKAPEREPDEELALLRDEQLSKIPAFDTLLRRSARVSAMQDALLQAGMKFRAGNFLLLCVLCGVAAGLATVALDPESRHRLGRAHHRRISSLLGRLLSPPETLRKIRRALPRSHRHSGPRRPRRTRLHHRSGNDFQRNHRAPGHANSANSTKNKSSACPSAMPS